MALAGQSAIVFGATGEVGRGAAIALITFGISPLFIAGRNASKLNTLAADLAARPGAKKIQTIVADYSTPEGAQSAHDQVVKYLGSSPLDHVISSSGPWWQLPSIKDASPAQVQQALAANIHSHLYVYTQFGNLAKRSYQLVNGVALRGLPHTGITGACAHAVDGISKLFSAELGRRFTQLLIVSSVGHADMRGPSTMDPAKFGKVFVAIALGLGSPDRQGTIVVDDKIHAELTSKLPR
eukprot:jgi/Mesvir1/16709/Mv15100-RA.1